MDSSLFEALALFAKYAVIGISLTCECSGLDAWCEYREIMVIFVIECMMWVFIGLICVQRNDMEGPDCVCRITAASFLLLFIYM